MVNQDANNDFEYDAAFSFSGEDRPFVSRVVELLKDKINVYYDYHDESSLVAKNIPNRLEEIFSNNSRRCVIFVSKSYVSRDYTRFELQCAQARFLKQSDYIILVKLDDSEIKGIPKVIGFIDGEEKGPEGVAQTILRTIQSKGNLMRNDTNNRIAEDLTVVDWRITCECDHTCRCCFGPKGIGYLDRDEAKKVVDRLHEQGIQTVCVSGGEPLTYPYIDEILTYLHENGFKIYLSTNGNHFWDHQEIIESCVKKLSLSLDGYIADIQSQCGRDKGNFEKIIKILDYYKTHEHKFQIKIGTLLSANNIHIDNLLMKIFQLLQNYPIDIWKIYELVPEGKIRYEKVPCESNEALFNHIIEEFESEKIKYPSPNFPILYPRRKNRNKAYFIIQPNGAVVIPEEKQGFFEENNLGNILTEPLNEIVENWKTFVNYQNYKDNYRFSKAEDFPRKQDPNEQLVLAELSKDATQTDKRISKSTKIPTNEVNRIIKLLHDRGILKSVIPVINVSKLGFNTFNIFLSIAFDDGISKEQILSELVKHKSIPWIVTTRGKWDFIIAVFADFRHLTFIMTDIYRICKNKIKSYEILSLYEEYIFGPRYLVSSEKEEEIEIENYWMALDDVSSSQISRSDLDILRKITGKKPYLFDFDSSYGEKYNRISSEITRLKMRWILVRFNISCDIQLLNYEWYLVLMRLINLSADKLKEFKNFISSFRQIIHIVFCVGGWDVKIEMHVDNLRQAEDIILQITDRYQFIIFSKESILIEREYKLDFLVNSVFEGKNGEIDENNHPCES